MSVASLIAATRQAITDDPAKAQVLFTAEGRLVGPVQEPRAGEPHHRHRGWRRRGHEFLIRSRLGAGT
jgi:hypothetical protein